MSSPAGRQGPEGNNPEDDQYPGRTPPEYYDLPNEFEDEDEDEDMDYEPESERSEDIEYFDDAESHEGDEAIRQGLFDDDDDGGLSNIQIEFTMDDEHEHEGENQEGAQRGTRVTSAQILQILGASGLRRILQSHGLDHGLGDDDDDDEYGWHFGLGRRRRRRQVAPEDLYPKVPSDVGRELMMSGHYGNNPDYVDDLKKRKKRLATRLMWRELGIETGRAQRRTTQSIFQDLIPGSVADKIIHFDSRCYSGQFSDDGNFFFCCSQDFKVRMYDTSNIFDWKYYKTVDYPFGQWTITDASLSPDNKYLAYSSIRHLVCLAPTDPGDQSDPILLDFSRPRRRAGGFYGDSHFGIWSIRFSGDGREIVAGTSGGSVIVYDVERREPTLRLNNHKNDVNAVCFGDTSSPHILYSGSDDTTLRVWDRRSMGDGREAGAFLGHTEGLTYVDSKGDGRYVLSNGKDQTMKLWDLRKMMTTSKFDQIDPEAFTTGFDYRFMAYPEDYYEPHPHDCSVVTFRGHRVLKTLIRCHFSPPGSTNSRYVYTGSEDGKVYIYNLDATLAGTIDVGRATLNSRPRDADIYASAYELRGHNSDMLWKTCVRDASWHPSAPMVAATSWNGWGMSTGTCTMHSWNAGARKDEDSPPGQSYNSKLNPIPAFNRYAESGSNPYVRSRPVYREPEEWWDPMQDYDEAWG
ncbi:WD repeat protein [Paecilomyces variotii No. 5]|uniref:WD repeat protein n=1 Tax=Byssochlamys spectabilis (strain No. 5 / NBRC 109023) TaxID=1356009 RepID=V5FRL2_BYSSN|nr:WD repeat protein [Paecilomyces variotii No. 5]